MLWTWVVRNNKRLWLALAISVLLHFLLVAGSESWLPSWLPDDEPLEVTLAPPPPVIKPAKPIQKIVPVVREHKPVHVAEQAPKPVPQPPVDTETALQPDPLPSAPTTTETLAEATPAPAPTSTQQESPPPVAKPEWPPQPVVASDPPPLLPPKHIEIEFMVDYDGASAVERQNYQVSDDGRYVISSTIEAKGLLSLALSDLNQKSTGKVTPQGLQPETFTYQYGKNSKKAQKANFDWSGKTLTMQVGDNKQSVTLQDGTQDLLSFYYQFMFTPPLSLVQLIITNGKQVKTYHYLFEGEEEIKTKLGILHTLHISKSSGNNDEKTEIWLAESYHYLPVRIRKTNSDGKIIQNSINAIRIDGAT
ncbi:MAG TPA: DUF3108 domain-containing protein [Methylophilaceae bacterium]|jgi:hypothetical protein